MKDKTCPCGSGELYQECCAPYIDGSKKVPSPEALMRSRFTAFAKGNLVYIEKTVWGPAKEQFDRKRAESLVKEVHWEKLEIIASHEREDEGMVEFCATFTFQGKTRVMREASSFKKIGGSWLYYSGDISFNR